MDVGATVRNERSGTVFTVTSLGDDFVTLRYQSVAATTVPDFPKHVHADWTEEFEIISGQGRYWADGAWKDIAKGETILHAPNTRHVHPMNAGEEPFEMIQTAKLRAPNRKSIEVTLGVLFTAFDRHAQGRAKIASFGYPVNPLYFAAIGKTLGDVGSYDGAIPIGLQKVMGATMGRLSLALGVDPIDDVWR